MSASMSFIQLTVPGAAVPFGAPKRAADEVDRVQAEVEETVRMRARPVWSASQPTELQRELYDAQLRSVGLVSKLHELIVEYNAVDAENTELRTRLRQADLRVRSQGAGGAWYEGALREALEADSAEDIETLGTLAEAKATLNSFKVDGTSTPLVYAVLNDKPAAAAALLRAGVDVDDATSSPGETALRKAVWYEKLDMARLLLRHGADVRGTHIERFENTNKGVMCNAVGNGDLDMMRLLWEAGASLEDTDPWSLDSPLETAVENGDVQSIEFLLSRGVKDLANALWSAAFDGAAEATVAALIRGGADPNVNCDDDDTRLYEVAAVRGSLDALVVMIRAGAHVDKENGYALVNAARQGYAPVVQVLLDAGVNIDARYECNPEHQFSKWANMTALAAASESDHVDVVRLLIQRGASLDATDVLGMTALMLAKSDGVRAALKQAGAAR